MPGASFCPNQKRRPGRRKGDHSAGRGGKAFSARTPIRLPPSIRQQKREEAGSTQPPPRVTSRRESMKKIAFAALAVLGIAVGTVNFAAPAPANYFLSGGASQENQGGNN